MMDSAILTLGVLAVAAFFFATEIISACRNGNGGFHCFGAFRCAYTGAGIFRFIQFHRGFVCRYVRNRSGNVSDRAGAADWYQSSKKCRQ